MAKIRNYKGIAKELRGVTPFLKNYDLRRKLTPGQKAAISRAYSDYLELANRAHTKYRPRKKSNLKVAQESSGHKPSGTKFSVAFIPEPEAKKIRVRKGKLQTSGKHVTAKFYKFNRVALAQNPNAEIARVIEQAMADGIKNIRINAGNNFFPGFRLAGKDAQNFIVELTKRYAATFPAWLTGFTGYRYTNQKSFLEYASGLETGRAKAKKARKKLTKYERRKGR